jgi:hypothetical protein
MVAAISAQGSYFETFAQPRDQLLTGSLRQAQSSTFHVFRVFFTKQNKILEFWEVLKI